MEYYYPKSSTLKKHIRYISFYASDEKEKEYLVFPNHGAAMVLGANLHFQPLSKNTFLSKESPGEYRNTLHVNRIDPVKIIEQGHQEKITIVFEPLGLNHFIYEPLSEFLDHSSLNNYNIEQSQRFPNFAKQVFGCHTFEQKLECIENYLLQRYIPFQAPFLADALPLLMDMDESYTVGEIAKSLFTNPRSLLRLFQKHICLSPVEFRNIFQFRYSLGRKIESGIASFKEISYESNYSDASYMVRMYKKFTGLKPSQFFEQVATDKYVIISL
jgi:AraC-like DNA-binding protein